MASGFIAYKASLPVIVSNLVYIVSADFFDIRFARYAAVMVPVNVVSVAATLLVLLLYFRRSIPNHYDDSQLKQPKAAIRDLATFRAGWVVLGLLLISFFTLEGFGIPVSAIAALGSVVLLIVAGQIGSASCWERMCNYV